MNSRSLISHALALTLLSSITLSTRAEQPGTNVATPLPAPAGDTTPYAASVSPAPIAAEPVIDTNTTRSTLPNRPLLVTGVVLFGGSYAASAIVAATSDRTADEKLYYPVAGPWMDLNNRNCDVNACPNKTLDKVLLVGDGVLQGLGALSLVMSLMIPEKTTRHWYLIGNEKLMLTPQLGRSTTALVAAGTF
jgi:hypothetical protein